MARKSLTPLRARRYPWDKWFARVRWFTLRRDTDYSGSEYGFGQLFRQTARGRGAKVRVFAGDGWVQVLILDPPGTHPIHKRNR